MKPVITCPIDNRSYTITKKLGKGGFADVYLGKSTVTGNVYAIKAIKKSSIKSNKQMSKTRSEIRLHSLCGITDQSINKYIVPFNKYWDDHQFIYILMKYCPNGSLQDWLYNRYKRYNEPIHEMEIKYIMKQVVFGVQYLHDTFSIIHRDLKLGNIMLDETFNIQICDFGLATQFKKNESRKYTLCGTPNFIAPEIARHIKDKNNKINNKGHSYEVDIWAIGAMMYTLFYGKPPFETSSIDHTVIKILNSEFSFPCTRPISERLKHLIQNILTVDVELRLSLKDILKHLFFTKGKMPLRLPPCSRKRRPTEKELFPEDENNNNDDKENINTISLRHEFNKKIVNVVIYINHSDKYGVGYILSNGYTGVLYNDQTSLFLSYDKRNIYYVVDHDEDESDEDKDDEIHEYDYRTFDEPKLNKKFKVFQAFAKKLWKEYEEKGDEYKSLLFNHDDAKNDIVYVKRYRNTKQAMIFQMNNNIIHSIFSNETQIGIDMDKSNQSMKIIVLQGGNYASLKEYKSAQLFNQTASKDIINCAKHIQKAINEPISQ